uniref:Kelch like family member 34 n=1 Tax=Leptobrachium leishanense TaxID=445787 RepID=A0A8C5P6Q0_9ANUR
SKLSSSESNPWLLISSLNKSQGQLCDVSLVVDGQEFPAHKSLLACSSDYFRAMFKEYTKESKAAVIHLKVISATGLENILDFIYTSWLSLSMYSLEDTLEAACYLQVMDAIPLCSQFVVNNCALENCCFAANIASKFYLLDAMVASEKYIINNLWRLLQEDVDEVELLELNTKSMLTLLTSDDIPKVDEKKLLNLTLKWLQYDKIRLLNAKALFENIRYGLLPLDTLRELYTQSKVPLTLVENVLGFDKVRLHCTCVIGNFLYVLGGESPERLNDDTTEISLGITKVVYRYDPRFDQWIQVASMLEKRAQFSCCVVNNFIFAMGGRKEDQAIISSVEMYDVNRNCWTKSKELPCKMHGHASTLHKNIIYISGGKSAVQVNSSKDVYSFNRMEGQWKKQALMTIARFGHQMATVNDAIFTFLGIYEPFSDIERYDPVHNQWTRLRPMTFDRFCYGLVVVEQTVLLLGGKKWQDAQEVHTQNIVGYDTENDCWEEICSLAFPFSGLHCAILQLSDASQTAEKEHAPNLQVKSC